MRRVVAETHRPLLRHGRSARYVYFILISVKLLALCAIKLTPTVLFVYRDDFVSVLHERAVGRGLPARGTGAGCGPVRGAVRDVREAMRTGV